MSSKILIVDDDANILAAYQRNLRKRFDIDTAPGGEQALELAGRQGPYAVLVADMQMPVMNGIELLIKAEAKCPDTVRIMLTGNADQKTARDAVNEGHIFRFLSKPCATEDLVQALTAGLKQYHLITAERELLEKTLTGTIKLLTEVLANTDARSFGLGQRIRDYMRQFLQHYHYAPTWPLEAAAELFRIGYVTLPPAVLEKARNGQTLSGKEQDLLCRVPDMGAHILENIPRLESVAQIVRYQNKNFDGSGYPPDQVAGEDIPVGARILKVLAELVQLEAHNIPKPRILGLLQQRPGAYDPRVLEAVFACVEIWPASAAPAKPLQVRCLSVTDLQVGHVLNKNIETPDGILIVSAGTILTAMMLQKLRNFAQLGSLKQSIFVQE